MLDIYKQDLENIRKHKFRGSEIRRNANQIEQGEKPNKYFIISDNRNDTQNRKRYWIYQN